MLIVVILFEFVTFVRRRCRRSRRKQSIIQILAAVAASTIRAAIAVQAVILPIILNARFAMIIATVYN